MRRPIYLFPVLVLLVWVFVLGGPQPEPSATTVALAATLALTRDMSGGDQDMASCPVLGTTMPKSEMIPVKYRGRTYYLCCQGCVPKFKANPRKYVRHPAPPLPPSAGMAP